MPRSQLAGAARIRNNEEGVWYPVNWIAAARLIHSGAASTGSVSTAKGSGDAQCVAQEGPREVHFANYEAEEHAVPAVADFATGAVQGFLLGQGGSMNTCLRQSRLRPQDLIAGARVSALRLPRALHQFLRSAE